MFNSSLFYYLTCAKGKCFSNQIIRNILTNFKLVLPIARLIKQRFFSIVNQCRLVKEFEWRVGTPATAPGRGWCPHQPLN
jgi:hypothetical protein